MMNSIQLSSVTQSCPTICGPMDCSTPGLPVHHQLPEFTQTHVHWVGDAIQPSHPLSSPSPPTFKISQHQSLFQWVGSSHQMTKVLEFQLQHQSFQWYSGLISFRIDWLDLLAVQGTLKSLLQHHSSKASILQCSLFFIVQGLEWVSIISISKFPDDAKTSENHWAREKEIRSISFSLCVLCLLEGRLVLLNLVLPL